MLATPAELASILMLATPAELASILMLATPGERGRRHAGHSSLQAHRTMNHHRRAVGEERRIGRSSQDLTERGPVGERWIPGHDGSGNAPNPPCRMLDVVFHGPTVALARVSPV